MAQEECIDATFAHGVANLERINAFVDTLFGCAAHPRSGTWDSSTADGELTAYVFDVEHPQAKHAIAWVQRQPGSEEARICAALVKEGQSIADALRSIGIEPPADSLEP
jgi:hypothetical protein